MHNRFIVAAMAAVLATVPAGALARDYQADRLLSSIDVEDLEAVVLSLGHTVEKTGIAGANSLRAVDGKGTKYSLVGAACAEDGAKKCNGLALYVSYKNLPGVTKDTVLRANARYSAVSIASSENLQHVFFTRYVILDHGVAMANLRTNVAVLLATMRAAMPAVRGKAPSSP